jgi:uncharacterized protein YidB (DUF937 family)
MNRLKMFGGAVALVASALIGGTLISAALAAPTDGDGTTGTTALANGGAISDAYADAYLDALAAELGVDRSALGPAAQAAANAAIDAAVAAGDLDAAHAEELKARIAELENPERLLVGHGILRVGHGPLGAAGVGFGLGEVVEAAATALGMEADAVIEALHNGSSLSELATTQGVDYETVSDAALAAVQEQVDTAVASGEITQEMADEVLARTEEWLAAGGEPRLGRIGPGPRGPWH